MGTHPMELIPMDTLRYQLEVNLVAPISVSQVTSSSRQWTTKFLFPPARSKSVAYLTSAPNKLRERLRIECNNHLQAFLPLLGTDRGRLGPPGKLIFIGSIYGSYSLPWTGAYCKHQATTPIAYAPAGGLCELPFFKAM